MSDHDLAEALALYRAGLEAEVVLLEQLDLVAARQRQVSSRRDYEEFSRESDERDRLTRSLLAIEDGLRAVRARLADARDSVTSLSGYREVVSARQRAAALVARILSTDEESTRALTDADLARRVAVASLEQGETTLAAYRRVLTPTFGAASLVDRRG